MSAHADDRSKLARLLTAIDAHAHRDALASLVLAAFSRQAEGRALFAGPELVDGMAAQRGVDAESAQLEDGNVLAILRRGPSNETEHLLLSALYLRGIAGLADAERPAALGRFAGHALWLEREAPYELFGLVDRVLSAADAALVWGALADAAIVEDGASIGARARNAARITALAASKSDAAGAALDRLGRGLRDPGALGLLAALRPQARPGASVSLKGRVGRLPPAPGFRGFLRLVSGFALLEWLGRGALALVGLRGEGELTLLDTGAVRARRRYELLGRLVRERETVLPRASLTRLGRSSRFPALALLIGALALGLGLLCGGLYLLEGARSGDGLLFSVGGGLILAGALADLVATAWTAGRRGEVSVFVQSSTDRLTLRGVELGEAERFLDAAS